MNKSALPPITTKPPFRAEHAGGLTRPDRLVAALRQADTGRLDAEELAEVRTLAMHDVVRMQQDIGFRAVTDGGFGQTSWQRDILLRMDGVREKTAGNAGKPAILEMVEPLRRREPILADAHRLLATIAKVTPKVAIVSPSIVSRAVEAKTIEAGVYRDTDELMEDVVTVWRQEIEDLAKAGCTYLQIDESLPTGISETRLVDIVRLLGTVIDGKPEGLTVCCRLSLEAPFDDGYERTAEILFSEIAADRFLLDMARLGAAGFQPLRHLPKDRIAVLGLVDASTPRLEKRDDIQRLIDAAAKHTPIEQLALGTNTGFAPVALDGGPTMDDQKRKLDVIVSAALDVWGTN
ncbi:MAG: hypothetical protein RLZ98_3207 [Pseudomonadota bacterium]